MASIERLINAAQGDAIIAALDRIYDSENGRDEFDTSKIMISVFAGANANSVFSYSYNGKICVTSVPTGVQTVIYCDPDTDFSINMVQLTSSFKAVCQDSTFSWPTPDDGYVTNTAKTIMPNDTFRIHLPASPGVGGFYIDYTSATYRLYQAWGIMAGTQIQMATGLPTMTISFDANGGTGTVPQDVEIPIYSEYTTPENSGLTRSGYYLAGWSTDPDAGVVGNYEHQDHENISLAEAYAGTRIIKLGKNDITLYAIWTEAPIIRVTTSKYSSSSGYRNGYFYSNGSLICGGGSIGFIAPKKDDILLAKNPDYEAVTTKTYTVKQEDLIGGVGEISVYVTYNYAGTYSSVTGTGVCSDWTFA